jgi:hypothetical protein
MDDKLTAVAQVVGTPHLAGAGTFTTTATMDDDYDFLVVRIARGTTINGAIVALCPGEQNRNVVTADVCIDGPPVP